MALPKLTAAQELMVDLLVARHRLGEPFWPVSTQLSRTYKTLRDKGYVEIIDGNVEGTDRLMLTRTARQELIQDRDYYVPPIKLEARDEIAALLEKLGGDPTTIRMIRNAAYGGKK